jgi:hypothetical protein
MIPKLYKYSIYYPFRREIYQRNACMLLDQSLQLVILYPRQQNYWTSCGAWPPLGASLIIY